MTSPSPVPRSPFPIFQRKAQELSFPADSYLVPFNNSKGLPENNKQQRKKMSKLKMKARAGVTLVELLVVMLIAVILAVSLLPMFKEYICKAQYNAEAVPVIATLRTKISLYQYENNKLPANPSATDQVASWEIDTTDKQKYVLASYTVDSGPTASTVDQTTDLLTGTGKTPLSTYNHNTQTDTGQDPKHLGWTSVLDIDYQDLTGKRSRPYDYVYYKIPCDSELDSAYIIGCFGSGRGGFAAGTGYAVCELNLVSVGKKYIGTFERYKAKEKDPQYANMYALFLGWSNPAANGDTVYCPQQIGTSETAVGSGGTDIPNVVEAMQNAGWKFTD